MTETMGVKATPILELAGISKLFPGVRALDNVHFDLRAGEIHGLLGENGAGKSTFIKIITGVHSPDTGEIRIDGESVTFANPMEAQRLGVAAIYQHVTSYPDLTVAENIFMGHEKTTSVFRRINWRAMHQAAQELLDQLDANFDSHDRMGSLSVARQQIVEIAKALSTEARIIIMDEPTAALTQHESEELYRITEGLRDAGVSVIFISHRMEDIWRLADRVTVFRDGHYIDTWDASGISQEKLIVAMVGREISQMYPKRAVKIGDEALRVENLTRVGFFRDVSFDVRAGEILALTGLVGAGRTEVCESIYGVHPADSGTIRLKGKTVSPRSPMDALETGIGYLPEDRQLQGLVLEWEIGSNITLPLAEGVFQRRVAQRGARNGSRRPAGGETHRQGAVSIHPSLSAFGRESTESGRGEAPQPFAQGHHPRRADQGCRRRGQSGDLRDHRRSRGTGVRYHHGLVRNAGGSRDERSDRRNERGTRDGTPRYRRCHPGRDPQRRDGGGNDGGRA
jgi:rhamnose transport system ATP-binding protein